MPAETKRTMAEVFIVHYNGLAPEKMEEYFIVMMPDGYVMKIAYPKFVKRSYGISHGEITLKNLKTGTSYSCATVLMEDIASIAVLNLENRINRIKAKAIARATMKYLASVAASKAVQEQHGELAGMLTQMTANIASVATEQADVRHWRLLPAEIRIGRIIVPAGDYSESIRFVSTGGAAIHAKQIPSFSLRERRKDSSHTGPFDSPVKCRRRELINEENSDTLLSDMYLCLHGSGMRPYKARDPHRGDSGKGGSRLR